jgi:hypothetical protein
LSKFKARDGEEEDFFEAKQEDVLREARENTNKWFHSWEKASTSKIENEELNDPDQESRDNDSFHSLDSEEEDDEGSPRWVKRRYPEWKSKWDLKDKSSWK